jgi:transaldolase
MKIFIDSANLKEIDKWLNYGIADGVTTNPSIMFKDGVADIKKRSIEIAKLINPRPLSVEVTTNDLNEMVKQAKTFAGWASNIAIKIPVVNEEGQPCLGVIKELSKAKIRVNATALLSLSQVTLVTKAGATYASIFAGRVGDEGGDASKVIQCARTWLDDWKYKTEIIVGSIRSVGDVQSAIIAGAHIITIPPQFIGKMCDHKYSRETVRQFIEDAKKTLEKIKK